MMEGTGNHWEPIRGISGSAAKLKGMHDMHGRYRDLNFIQFVHPRFNSLEIPGWFCIQGNFNVAMANILQCFG